MARRVIFPLQRELNHALTAISSIDYFQTIDRLTVIFRISGDARDFGGDGPERFRYIEADNELTADLVIPAKKWKAVKEQSLRNYIRLHCQTILTWMIEKAESLGENKRPELLAERINTILNEFGDAE